MDVVALPTEAKDMVATVVEATQHQIIVEVLVMEKMAASLLRSCQVFNFLAAHPPLPTVSNLLSLHVLPQPPSDSPINGYLV